MQQLTKEQKDKLFERIITNDPSNNFVYNQLLQTMIYNRNQVVPFVGAGLSMFVFKTWGGLLKDLLAQAYTQREQTAKPDHEKITDLIAKGDYFSAADELEGIIDSDVFYFSLAQAFSEEKFVDRGVPNIPNNAAVQWLPKVFPDSRIITTNYDSVIEWVYAVQKLYLKVCTPRDDRSFMQFLPRRLFKIHGSYDSNYEEIVFTSKSYNEKYAPNSALYNNFKYLVRSSVLLFIGASLRADKTLDLLEELARELTTQGSHYSGNMHFAILNIADNENRVTRKQELARCKIMPILYSDADHDGYEDKHLIVSVVLEHLFNDLSKRKVAGIAPIPPDNDFRDRLEPAAALGALVKTETDDGSDYNSRRLLKEDPLLALHILLARDNLASAESMIPEFENNLPPEIFLSNVLSVLAARGSTLAAERLFSFIKDKDAFEHLSFSQKRQIAGSLVSYSNRQDKETAYMDILEAVLAVLENEGNTEGKAFAYNQYAKLYFGAYTTEEDEVYLRKATEYALRACENKPDEPSYNYNLALILREGKDLDGAKNAIARCINSDTNDEDHLRVAYEIFKAVGDERSEGILQRLKSVNPLLAEVVRTSLKQ